MANDSIPVAALIDSIITLLTEAYDGPTNPSETWFIDNQPNSGILGILAGVSAEEASRPVHPQGEAGSTIAANAEHLRWSLENANRALRGGQYQGNWSESWQTIAIDEAGWNHLREALRSEYLSLREAVRGQSELPGPYLNGVLALIPHAVYHLGTIKQMVERVR